MTDYNKLYQYIKSKLNKEKQNYIFLDEIQHVKDYQKAIDVLYIKDNGIKQLYILDWLLDV